MTLFRLETLEERVNKLISPGRHGRYDIYKIQLLDDGSVVSAALHELGKGMPDSPDPSTMAELFEETVLNKKKKQVIKLHAVLCYHKFSLCIDTHLP